MSFSSPSSDFVRLSTATITADTASVTFDGFFTSDYDTYIIYGNNILLDTVSGSNFNVRYRVSNSDVTTNNYFMVQYAIASASSANVSVQHPATSLRMNYNEFTSSANHTAHFVITLSDPNNNQGAKYKQLHYNIMYLNSAGYTENVHGSVVNTNATTALSGLKFFPTNGNFDSGSIVLYGVKK